MSAGESDDTVQILIALEQIEPPVWRGVQVPAGLPLRRLHDVIQAHMGWLDCHLYQFEVGGKVYGPPELAGDGDFGPPTHSDRNTRLAQLIGRGVERFTCTYDFGDDWRHDLVIERTLSGKPGTEYPILIDGERRAVRVCQYPRGDL